MKMNLSIRGKLILLLVIFVSIFTLRFFVENGNKRTAENLEHLAQKAIQIDLQMLKLRKSEKDFLLRDITDENFFKNAKSSSLDKYEGEIEIVHKLFADLKSDKTLQEMELSSKVDELDGYFDVYHNNFNSLVKALSDRGYRDYGTIGEMRLAVQSVENVLKIYPELQVEVLTLRKHEKDYLLRKDLRYTLKFLATINLLKQEVEKSKFLSTSEKNDIQVKLKKYESSFNAVLKGDEEIGFKEDEGLRGKMRLTVHKIEPAVFQLVEEIDTSSEKIKKRANIIMLVFMFILLVFLVSIVVLILRSILRSINTANNAIQKLSEGDLNFEIEITSNDEIGEMLKNLKTMTSKLRSTVEGIMSGSEQIASASEESSSSSQEMSEGVNEQASSIEEVSATMEEMTANMQQSTSNAQQTEVIAHKASLDIKLSSKAVIDTVESMKIITDKITLISDIAKQTNILALNAAVEAARAGANGKGFAVVAAEVKNLAERSAKVAEEIDEVSAKSVLVAKNAGKMLVNIVPDIEKTAVLVAEITSAIAEQSASSEQISNSIDVINKVTQQNSAVSEELAASSEELSSQANLLKQTISFFNMGNQQGDHSNTKKGGTLKGIPIKTKRNGLNSKLIDTGIELDLTNTEDKGGAFESF